MYAVEVKQHTETSIATYIAIFTTATQYNMANREYRYNCNSYIAIYCYTIISSYVLDTALFLAD